MLSRVERLLGPEAAQQARDADELRVRLGRPLELRRAGVGRMFGAPVMADDMALWVAELTQHSMYACEPQLRQGYFTLSDGCRVGVSGVFAQKPDGQWTLQRVTSLSLRVSREIRDAAARLIGYIRQDDRALSTLILSAPGLGKTTLLRDCVRRLSEAGLSVAVSDERGEISGMVGGMPSMDLGPCTDVSVGCPRAVDVPRLVRAMSPGVIATDELGDPDDALALGEAVRAGVAILATAHASGYDAAMRRRSVGRLLQDGLFDRIVELRDRPGHIARVLDAEGAPIWTD